MTPESAARMSAAIDQRKYERAVERAAYLRNELAFRLLVAMSPACADLDQLSFNADQCVKRAFQLADAFIAHKTPTTLDASRPVPPEDRFPEPT